MATNEGADAPAITRRGRKIQPPAWMKDNGDAPLPKATSKPNDSANPSVTPVSTDTSHPKPTPKPKRKASIEDVEDPDSDIEVRDYTKHPKRKALVVDTDDEDDDVPPPSELERSPSRSSMAPSEAGTAASEGDEGADENGDEDRDERPEGNEEEDVAYIERMLPKLNAGVYAFFKPKPEVEWRRVQPLGKGPMVWRRYIKFECAAPRCKSKGKNGRYVYRATVGGDKSSTKNLRSHVECCWGKEALDAACKVEGGASVARGILKGRDNSLRDGSIVSAFENKAKVTVTYSTRPPTKVETKANHVLWMAQSKRPFEIVNDEGYKLNMKEGRPQQYIPSPSTVRRDVKVAFAKCRQKLAKILQEHDGALHFGTDCWTSPNNRAFIGLTVQYEVAGVVRSWCLDIVELPKRHTGVRLAEAFTGVLNDFKVVDKFLACVCDNASPNDVMVESFHHFCMYDDGEANRVRCFCHIINLICKSIIAQFDVPKATKVTKRAKPQGGRKPKKPRLESGEVEMVSDIEMEEEEGVDGLPDDGKVYYVLDNDLDGGEELSAGVQDLIELADDIEFEEKDEQDQEAEKEIDKDNMEGWVDERKTMSKEERAALAKSVMPIRGVLVKIRKVAYSVKNSSTYLLPKWKRLCEQVGLKERTPVRDVKTRWNSTFDMLDFAIEYRKVIDLITDMREAGLRKYELSKQEWKWLQELRDALKIFKECTEFFSRKNEVHLSSVIPAMDDVDQDLATAISQKKLSPPILAALAMGKRTLNRYYSKTDMSETYRIALVLDPRWKLEYLREAKWKQEWIETAEGLVRDTFEAKYKVVDDLSEPPTPASKKPSAAPPKPKNRFDNLKKRYAGAKSDTSTDEITRFLATPCVETEDPLLWWVEHAHVYPRLSRMARDYMCIPATSVDVERMFSAGRVILNHLRCSMKPPTFRALVCLGDWISTGLITRKDIATAINGLPDLGDQEEEYEEGWDHIQ